MIDPYRAATHNKGVMNGIDAVALATGNDWRAIEAAAHAWAGRGPGYTALTRWSRNEAGDLLGVLELPLKVGTVGGPVQANPAAGINLRMLSVQSARELACVMGAVGLAQNFSALRALVTEGIQAGHMTLHARGVALAAGATPEIFDAVVQRLISTGEIKVWKAQAIVAELLSHRGKSAVSEPLEALEPEVGSGHGKVILLGEHAVVYGRHGLAAPVSLAIRAKVEEGHDDGVRLLVPAWGVEERVRTDRKHPNSMHQSLLLFLKELGLEGRSLCVKLFPAIPRAMGLGGSAAAAVAVIRALANHFNIVLSDAEVCRLAYASEQIAHGTPSGIDNTIATYGEFVLFQKGEPPTLRPVHAPKPIPIVLGLSGVEGLTAKTVAVVRHMHTRNPKLIEPILDQIDALVLQAVQAVENYDLRHLGDLMNINHGLLNALQVSSPELETLVTLARNHGAWGAKLTGGGGGGAMVALCPENAEAVAAAMRQAGFQAIITEIG